MIKNNQSVLNKLMVLIDALIIGGTFVLSYLIKFYILESEPGVGVLPLRSYVTLLPFLIVVYLIIYLMTNVYTPKRTTGMWGELWMLLRANIFGLGVLIIALFGVIHGRPYARSVIAIFFVLSMCVESFFRIMIRSILRRIRLNGYNKKHILLVGYSRSAEAYIDRIRMNPEWGYNVVGILDNEVPIGTEYYGIKVLDKLDALEKMIQENSFDEVSITLSLKDYDFFENMVNICEKNGVHTKFVPDYNSIVSSKPYTEDLDGLAVVNIRFVPLSNAGNRLIKRLVDILGSLFGIIITSPIMLITALLVKTTSKGPVLFKQERVGYHGKNFNMYKFRSMRVQTADEEKKGWTTKGDPRVTPIGRFIRKTSIDELPQLFNILSGDMSLVGPRPERPQYVEKFKEEIPRYMVKHQVRPGLTGWAQVNGLRGDTSIKKRIEYDLYYIENWTFFFDIKIIIMTFFTGFINKNAY
ncbi:MAG: undecaprenyl-phosphate glucose phosphotransferase [Lachnospiraceae bacterium]|nr:undecaprenyl-phosphate glucose phosphotransferase [Lachnospiraceae bacterium]